MHEECEQAGPRGFVMIGCVLPGPVLAAALLLASVLGMLAPHATRAQERVLQNDIYRIEMQPDGGVLLRREGTAPIHFSSAFTVLHAPQDPQLELRPATIPNVQYNVPTWKPEEESLAVRVDAGAEGNDEVGDGFDPRILEGERAGRTADYFQAAHTTTLSATAAERVGDKIIWRFPEHSGFALRAHLTLRQGREEPALHVTLVPKVQGWYSIGYTGAPEYALDQVEEMWQPLIWQEKRFPDQSYLTTAFRAPVPTTLVRAHEATIGIVAAPSELPFQPLPTFENSRFGVTVRSASGAAQPALFAPVLGGIESHMAPGQPYDFEMRLLVHPGDGPSAFRHVARSIFGFEDYRQNANGYTLNETIENMIDYGLSEYAHFSDSLKGASYATDVPGAVKNVSSLFPLSVAMITDSEAIYQQYAYPMIEYMLSREKFLFTVDPEITGQAASWRMKGPAAPLTELAALYEVSGRRTPVFLYLADSLLGVERVLNLETKVRGDSWPNLLAMYRATSDKTYLRRATAGADAYIEKRVDRRATDYEDAFVGGEPFFWTQFAPAFIPLYDLYEETGEPRYLDAALRGARKYTMFVWMAPRIPDEHVLVNEGGQAPQYWYLKAKGHEPMAAPEGFVEAWKLSEIGLTAESSGTSSGHRGIFMANPAPWLLRLARDGDDGFLHDVARSAVIGRYANFPGYHLNTARTDVFMRPDYPLRPHKELSYNSFHYNHIWPHIALLFDYLVAEAYYRSDGEIDFPAHYGEGYAYLQNRVYGARAGRFYESDDARLWMPRGLVEVSDDQVNHLAARGDNGLYLALMNESGEVVKTTVRLNADLAGIEGDRAYPVSVRKGPVSARKDPVSMRKDSVSMRKDSVSARRDSVSARHDAAYAMKYPISVRKDTTRVEDAMLENGTVTVSIAPRGLTALTIQGIVPQPRFQHRIGSGPELSDDSFASLDVGGTRGMLLSMGKSLVTAYVYLQATHKDIWEARLCYRTKGDWSTIVDTSYPFEFTRALKAGDERFEFYVETVGTDGAVRKSKSATLRR